MVTISHSSSFKHKLDISVVSQHWGPTTVAEWTWTGIGVPPEMPQDIAARVSAVITEHLVTRYGVAGTLF
jgi:hypothetical protein